MSEIPKVPLAVRLPSQIARRVAPFQGREAEEPWPSDLVGNHPPSLRIGRSASNNVTPQNHKWKKRRLRMTGRSSRFQAFRFTKYVSFFFFFNKFFFLIIYKNPFSPKSRERNWVIRVLQLLGFFVREKKRSRNG